MGKSTTIINHLNTDKVVEINISQRKYIAFTLMYRNLIVIEVTDKEKPVLLCNRSFKNKASLNNEFDKIIISASNAIDNDDFVSGLDTYIDLNDSNIKNDTTKEIISVYKIIVEDYNI